MSVVPLPDPPALDSGQDKPNLSPSLPPRPAVTVSRRKRTFPEQVWSMLACFRSVQLAIVLLSLLALATLAGVMLPQDGLVPVADIKREFGGNYRWFKAMGLFNVYSSYWFIALETLFFINLLCGSFQWLRPACLAATQVLFRTPGQIAVSERQLAFTTALSVPDAAKHLAASLKKARYRVHLASIDDATDDAKKNHDKNAPGEERLLYACKGNFSRLGPAVAHFGILLMLASSVYGTFFGFKAQQLAVPGQTFDIGNAQMFKPNVDAGLWLGSVPSWKIRVDDFRIVYYKPGEAPQGQASPSANGMPATIKQYYADLSVLGPDGKAFRRETISVNHPLTVDDTVIYQASFSPTGKLFVDINGQRRTLDANSRFMNRSVSFLALGGGKTLLVFPFFVQQDPGVTRNNAVFFLRDQQGFVGAQSGKMPPSLRLAEGESGTLAGMTLRYVRPEIATGLQIKKGPEVPWMYLSYLIIVAGTVMCIFSQRRLWLTVTNRPGSFHDNSLAGTGHDIGNPAPATEIRIAYQSNKAHISFVKELCRLERQWRDNGFSPLNKTPNKTRANNAQNRQETPVNDV